MCQTITQGSYKYGIGMLWNPNTVGKPIETDPQKVETPNDGSDPQRAYIVAEFRDFCFVATHYSLNQAHREEMSNQILQHSIVQKCISTRKPVYVAGDMNEGYNGKAIKIFKDNDYNILNNTKDSTHATWTKGVGDGKYIDLILEKNTSPYHKKIDCGIPIPAKDRDYWLDTVKISDHFPYFVKVKVK